MHFGNIAMITWEILLHTTGVVFGCKAQWMFKIFWWCLGREDVNNSIVEPTTGSGGVVPVAISGHLEAFFEHFNVH